MDTRVAEAIDRCASATLVYDLRVIAENMHAIADARSWHPARTSCHRDSPCGEPLATRKRSCSSYPCRRHPGDSRASPEGLRASGRQVCDRASPPARDAAALGADPHGLRSRAAPGELGLALTDEPLANTCLSRQHRETSFAFAKGVSFVARYVMVGAHDRQQYRESWLA